MIWKYLKMSKVITNIAIGIFIIVSFFSFWNYTTVNNRKYKKLLIERDTLIVHKAKLNKWANDTQIMLDETMQAKKTNDSLFQILVQEQSKDIKAKAKAIERYKNGLICKVPQKIKVGFMKHRTVLVEVNCDSLEKTLR
jgi:predicted GNAT family acetyltransferase